MIQNTEELAEFVRQNIPQLKSVSQLKVNAASQTISFKWNSIEFLVRQTLEVYQVKGTTVEITAASLLMQALLQTTSRVQKMMEVVVESLGQSQDFLKRNEIGKGMELLTPAKRAIAKLVPKQLSSRTA